MANPSKKKGTGAETELVTRLNNRFGAGTFKRNETNAPFDIFRVPTESAHWIRPIEALFTRPDRGQWLVTMTLEEFEQYLEYARIEPVHIEVKRYAKFSLHTLFESKFGRAPVVKQKQYEDRGDAA